MSGGKRLEFGDHFSEEKLARDRAQNLFFPKPKKHDQHPAARIDLDLSTSRLVKPFDLDGARRQGSDYIRWVQQSINSVNGTTLPVDGLLTADTRQAVREFQRKYGLVPDGIVGPRTEQKLEEAALSRPPRLFDMTGIIEPLLAIGVPIPGAAQGQERVETFRPEVRRPATEFDTDFGKLSASEQHRVIDEVQRRFDANFSGQSEGETPEERFHKALRNPLPLGGPAHDPRSGLIHLEDPKRPESNSERPVGLRDRAYGLDESRPSFLFIEKWIGTPAQQRMKSQMVFLDVQNQGGRVSVAVSRGEDLWLEEDVGSQQQRQEVYSGAQLGSLIGNATTIVHRGDDLPPAWQKSLRQKTTYVRNSDRSPKKSVRDFIQAAELLEHTAKPGTFRILSALPHETERRDLIRQLDRMDLDRREVDAWQGLQREMAQVQADSGYTIDVATKDAFLRELQQGSLDYIVLVAHYADGRIHFPDGSTLSDMELSALRRWDTPDRTLVLISCSTGVVNATRQSPAEIVLKNNMARNVVAPPDPISALQVPGMLHDYLIGRKKIREVFSGLGFVTTNDPPKAGPQTGPELAVLLPAQ